MGLPLRRIARISTDRKPARQPPTPLDPPDHLRETGCDTAPRSPRNPIPAQRPLPPCATEPSPTRPTSPPGRRSGGALLPGGARAVLPVGRVRRCALRSTPPPAEARSRPRKSRSPGSARTQSRPRRAASTGGAPSRQLPRRHRPRRPPVRTPLATSPPAPRQQRNCYDFRHGLDPHRWNRNTITATRLTTRACAPAHHRNHAEQRRNAVETARIRGRHRPRATGNFGVTRPPFPVSRTLLLLAGKKHAGRPSRLFKAPCAGCAAPLQVGRPFRQAGRDAV